MTVTDWLAILRPAQWLKNLMLFFPIFLGGSLLAPGMAAKGLMPFIAFCLAASSCYILNDIMDREKDLCHPVKKYRRIASGKIPVSAARLATLALGTGGLGIALLVSPILFMHVAGYLLLTLLYSIRLKDVPVVDLFCITAGFLIRLSGGGAVFGIGISNWLFLSVFLLSIFLSTGKRLGEKNRLGVHAGSHRRSLDVYPAGFLEGTMFLTGGAVLVTYTMYVISHGAVVLLVVLSAFGLLRYIFRVMTGREGDPTESLLRDVPLLVVSVAWVLVTAWSVYL